MVRYWTMRFEARHNYFKKLARSIGNYTNLSYTLAMRNQYLQCYYNKSRSFVEVDIEIGPGKPREFLYSLSLLTL